MTHRHTPAASPQAIAEVLAQVGHIADSLGYSGGLKPAQWTALRYFAHANESRRTVSAFADFHATTRGAASQMVDVLVKKGLLTRVPVPEDRRTIRLNPTPEALALLKDDPLKGLIDVIGELAPDQQFLLAEVLARMVRGLMLRRLPMRTDADISSPDSSAPDSSAPDSSAPDNPARATGPEGRPAALKTPPP